MKLKKYLVILVIGVLFGICSADTIVNAEETEVYLESESEDYSISELYSASISSPQLNCVTVSRDTGLRLG